PSGVRSPDGEPPLFDRRGHPMPADPNSSPPPPQGGKPRRRPQPAVGGNWIWLVILLVLGGMFLFQSINPGGALEWSEFYSLLAAGKLKKIVLVGTERITGEVKDADDVPADIKKKLRGGKFSVQRLRADDKDFVEQMNKQSKEHGLIVTQEDDHYAWL